MDLGQARVARFPLPGSGGSSTPQAVILAAGRGSRLGADSVKRPKCLTEVGGRSLLDHQLDMLAAHDVHDVCVVIGYKGDAVRAHCGDRVRYVENPQWADTNSLFSFWLTREWVDRGAVVLNCDVLAHPELMSRLLASRRSNLVYDGGSGGDPEHMKVCLADDCLQLMSKHLKPAQVHGENVGMLYFEREHASELYRHAGKVLREGGQHSWLAEAVQRTAQAVPIEGVDISDLPWIEIDFVEDLEAARQVVWPAIAALASPQPRRLATAATGKPLA